MNPNVPTEKPEGTPKPVNMPKSTPNPDAASEKAKANPTHDEDKVHPKATPEPDIENQKPKATENMDGHKVSPNATPIPDVVNVMPPDNVIHEGEKEIPKNNPNLTADMQNTKDTSQLDDPKENPKDIGKVDLAKDENYRKENLDSAKDSDLSTRATEPSVDIVPPKVITKQQKLAQKDKKVSFADTEIEDNEICKIETTPPKSMEQQTQPCPVSPLVDSGNDTEAVESDESDNENYEIPCSQSKRLSLSLPLKFTRKKVPIDSYDENDLVIDEGQGECEGHSQNETQGDDTEYGDTEDTDEATAESGSE